MIIPNQNNKYSSLERFAVTKFDLNNILVYDNDIKKQNLLNAFDGNSRQTFGGNSHFTLNLSDTVTDEVICVDNTMFQFIKGKNMTVSVCADRCRPFKSARKVSQPRLFVD